MRWHGVSVDTLLAAVQLDPKAAFVIAYCDGGYTTNLPLQDLLDGQAWVAFEFEGEPLDPVHGGPARLLVPHLYFWKSAKWVSRLELMAHDRPGFWEQNGYHMRGDPWAEDPGWTPPADGAAVSSWRRRRASSSPRSRSPSRTT